MYGLTEKELNGLDDRMNGLLSRSIKLPSTHYTSCLIDILSRTRADFLNKYKDQSIETVNKLNDIIDRLEEHHNVDEAKNDLKEYMDKRKSKEVENAEGIVENGESEAKSDDSYYTYAWEYVYWLMGY
jgi:hypothetical protein